MSGALPRDLRCLMEIKARLEGIGSPAVLARVLIGKDDLHADSGTFPAASLLVGGDDTPVDSRGNKHKIEVPVTVHLVTKDVDPDNPLVAGYTLRAAALAALFPESARTQTTEDRLGGHAESFEFQGASVLPREDGGKTTSVFIDTLVRYVLLASDPYL
ncbi:MAG TPA: hypothetical protein VFS13_00595 [Steroidobacteraceae bacterium]|nr:hypothetical protein [Steroidobacteraceae bacterium]